MKSTVIKYIFIVFLILYFINLMISYKDIVNKLDILSIYPYCISGAGFGLLYYVILKKYFTFWEVFLHELTHVTFTLLTFNKIESFSASFSGGSTVYRGKSTLLIRLSPYCFPLISSFLMVTSIIIKNSFLPYFFHLISVSYTLFICSVFTHFRFDQPDIKKSGIVVSLVFVSIINILFLGLVIFFLQQDVLSYTKILLDAFFWKFS
ncbi:MAG: hypothetical protein B6226_05130 [Candidatus Cloacimonetes bacterium 4572_65]|nr:MAG: hypothetical protein B6226_05130 [Candidatus Cloacimonetes bacterium 4572_65]